MGATVYIYDSDSVLFPDMLLDDLIASGTTAVDGTFSIDWEAEDREGLFDNKMEMYAIFKETDAYLSSMTTKYNLTVT